MKVHIWFGGGQGTEGPIEGEATFNPNGTADLTITDPAWLDSLELDGPYVYKSATRFNGASVCYDAYEWSPIRNEAVALPDPMTLHGWESLEAAAREGVPVSFKHCLGWFVIASTLKEDEHVRDRIRWELTLGDGAGHQRGFTGVFSGAFPGRKAPESRFDRDDVV